MFQISLGNPSKDSQRFVDAVVLISAPDWSVRILNFKNVIETRFVFSLLGFSKLNFTDHHKPAEAI